jgi:L-alanine-DL-glutamate epimerase-like enolase superfamily enzyme
VARKSREAASSSILKVKLGRGTDKEIINAIRTVTAKPLYVDVNQGWTDKHEALDMIHWLKGQGVVLVEQPMPAGAVEEMAWLTQHSPLPTVADEAVQVVADVKKMAGVYSGINIKLMKCGGMRAALKMAAIARGLDLEVMLGCMVETSCAVSAAAQLSPLAKWCDLDGNLLITNDVFDGMKIVDGKVTLSERPGIGAVPLF